MTLGMLKNDAEICFFLFERNGDVYKYSSLTYLLKYE